MQTKTLALAIVCLAGCLAARGQQTPTSKPDFSGTWAFDPDRSSLQIASPDSSTFVIEHREPHWRLERTHVFGGSSDTFTLELTTDGKPVTFTHRGFEVHARLYWDGETLVFDSTLSHEGHVATNVVRYKLADGGRTFIAEERMQSEQETHDNFWFFEKSDRFSWSPETADLLFVSHRDGNSEIYLLPGGFPEAVNLTNHPAGDNLPEWSPDGERIAFQSSRGGGREVWVMNADGSGAVPLTDSPGDNFLPVWSPDGKRIAFASSRREPGDTTRENHVYVMNADGSGQRRLFAASFGISPRVDWSPDGSSFVLARKVGDQGPDIFVVDHDGGILQRLTDEAYNDSPAFSPHGSRVAFVSKSGGRSTLMIVSLDGSERRPRVESRKIWSPRWSPDGRWLLFSWAVAVGGSNNRDVIAIPASGGGEPRILAGGPGYESEGRWRPRP